MQTGLAQMTVGFVNPPKGQENNPAAIQSTKDARKLMIRYINAGFRLMYLETLPISSDEVGKVGYVIPQNPAFSLPPLAS